MVINGSNPDYINTKMEDHSWYVGNMDRDSANAELEDFPQVGALLMIGCAITHRRVVKYS